MKKTLIPLTSIAVFITLIILIFRVNINFSFLIFANLLLYFINLILILAIGQSKRKNYDNQGFLYIAFILVKAVFIVLYLIIATYYFKYSNTDLFVFVIFYLTYLIFTLYIAFKIVNK